ncbi:MAG TPA: PilT/PilU family type 4a pilus ATPase [Planctomycetota bacterium]|nr:PilT/PilU family type 4a pilus ATPase [Planctomycetota bacterium]
MDLKKLLALMVSRRASDLIMSAGSPPTLRVDGKLAPLQMPSLDAAECRETILQCMTEQQQQELEKHRDSDFSYGVPALGRFRVNAHSQRGSVAAAIRLVSASTPNIRDLGLPPIVTDLADKTKGLLLVTGPTGSGKSTTLAAIVQRINENRRCHVITIEDPIEHVFNNDKSIIEQREVGADTPGFAAALRHVLRQDPDVIMIGEMRDKETISAAITAAETGHFVLSTLHTNDTAQTIDRIVDVFEGSMQPQIRLQLSMVLVGIISQQLIERRGGGRTTACEVLVNTPGIGNLIRKGETAQIKNAVMTGSSSGMVSMQKSVQTLVSTGIIDKDATAVRQLVGVTVGTS